MQHEMLGDTKYQLPAHSNDDSVSGSSAGKTISDPEQKKNSRTQFHALFSSIHPSLYRVS